MCGVPGFRVPAPQASPYATPLGGDVSGKLALIHNDPECGVAPDTLQRLLDAGAAGVLVDAWLCRMPIHIVPEVDNTTRPRIPYVAIPGSEAERLAGLLAAGPVTITVTSTPVSPYTYYLTTFDRGSLPATPRYRYRSDDFVTIDARYHSGVESYVNIDHYIWHPGDVFQFGQATPSMSRPRRRSTGRSTGMRRYGA